MLRSAEIKLDLRLALPSLHRDPQLEPACGTPIYLGPPVSVQFFNEGRPLRVGMPVASDRERTAPAAARPRKSRIRRSISWMLSLLLGCALTMLVLGNAHLDSLFFHRAVAKLSFEIKPGASPAVLFPRAGR